eukprot:scaffold10166_cov146-Isochrysis_galbana.AAC.3
MGEEWERGGGVSGRQGTETPHRRKPKYTDVYVYICCDENPTHVHTCAHATMTREASVAYLLVAACVLMYICVRSRHQNSRSFSLGSLPPPGTKCNAREETHPTTEVMVARRRSMPDFVHTIDGACTFDHHACLIAPTPAIMGYALPANESQARGT